MEMSDYSREEAVCHRCFNDPELRAVIREEGRAGVCPWCGRKGSLVPLTRFSEPFRGVASVYVPVEGPTAHKEGDLIGTMIDDSWKVFDEKIQCDGLVQDLVVSILYADLHPKERFDGPDYEGFFQHPENQLEGEWHEMACTAITKELPSANKEGLKSIGRDIEYEFPSQIEVAFEDLATCLSKGEVLFRARIHKDRARKVRYEKHELGAPPSEFATSGRANQEGKPVLYLSSNRSTAIAEVRALRDAVVALAPVRIKRDLLLVDLKQRRSIRSPFFVELLKWRIHLNELLYRRAISASSRHGSRRLSMFQLKALIIRYRPFPILKCAPRVPRFTTSPGRRTDTLKKTRPRPTGGCGSRP